MKLRIFGGSLIIIAAVILVAVLYINSTKRHVPIIFSDRAMLAALWNTYKFENVEEGGRTLDKERNNITTSEGQSYTMLRAVWLDDKETFDRTWRWTKENLQRDDDSLFSWLYGQRPDGSYGIITEQGGGNAASDGDTDIALALLFAYNRWDDASYLGEARAILDAIWEQEVVEIGDAIYMAANNLEKESSEPYIIVNPSYLAPYAYRVFAEVDTEHEWIRLVDSSYDVIKRSIDLPLDKEKSAGLPPDWILVDRNTGEIRPSTTETLTTNYGFDALRIPFRLALDWMWYREPRAEEVLNSMVFLSREWSRNTMLYTTYAHDGTPTLTYESPAMYGGSLGYFMISDRQAAREVYDTKLRLLYNPDTQTWKEPIGYYSANMAWFGLALYNGELPNLASSITK